MKKLLFVLVIASAFVSCEKENIIVQDFQVIDKEAQVPALYFYKETDPKPIIKGNVKCDVNIELLADNNTSATITGTFHLGYKNIAGKYERDIYSKDFSLKKGDMFKYSDKLSFYGSVYDKIFILIDISTKSPVRLTTNPVSIVKSDVFIVN